MNHRLKKLAVALATAALATGLTIAGTGTAHAAVTPPTAPDSWAEIYAPEINANHITLCADNNRSLAQNTSMQLWRCHGYGADGAPQRWQFQLTGNVISPIGTFPIYRIAVEYSSLCLGLPPWVGADGTRAGVRLVQESCIGNNLTNWIFMPATNSPDPNNQFILVNAVGAFSNPYAMEADTFLDQNGNPLISEPMDPWNSAQWFALG
jgi:hypothetical protein